MARSPPFRRFTHADGRQWEVRLCGSVVELRITSDGETVSRRRPFDAPVLGAQALDAMVREQLDEGFVEQTPPEWKRRLDELVTFWEEDDPGFDADVLRSQFLAAGEPLAMETMEKLSWWETGQPRDPALARAWLSAQADTVLPGLLLALRYADAQVQVHLDALLSEQARPEIVEALLSVIEHPTPLAEAADGGRPAHMPLLSMLKLGRPDDEGARRLVAVFKHDDPRAHEVAAALLAEFSADDALFALLWKQRTLAKKSEGVARAMLRAAEVRRDPALRDFLLWMQKAAPFKAPPFPQRISDALAHLRNR
jgi:hypothetical protein